MGKAKRVPLEGITTLKLPPRIIPGLECATAQESDGVEWEWAGRIMRNHVNMIDANKRMGKSTVMTRIAVTISNGGKFPGERRACRGGNVLWFANEEPFYEIIKPRWIAHGGDPHRLHRFDFSKVEWEDRIFLPSREELLTDVVRQLSARVVVCDPFDAILDHGLSINDGQPMRKYLQSFVDVAMETKSLVLLSRHFKKGTCANYLHQGLGSVQISNVPRVMLRIDPLPGEKGSYVLSTAATNCGVNPKGITYTIGDGGAGVGICQWGKLTDLTVEEIMEGVEDEGSKDERIDAVALLKALLKNGDVPFSKVKDEYEKAGISLRTIRTAKAKLRISSHILAKGKGEGRTYLWRMPKAPPPSE